MGNNLESPQSTPPQAKEHTASASTATSAATDSYVSSSSALEEYRKRYDAICFQVLTQKQVLVPLLQNSVDVFSTLSSEQVLSCLAYEPLISKVPVHRRDLEANADVDDIETYNIVVETKTPCPKLTSNNFLIDIEVQDDFQEDPSFDAKRSLYYVCSQISKQLPDNPDALDPNNVKSCRSIWIYLNPILDSLSILTFVPHKADLNTITGKLENQEPDIGSPVGYSVVILGDITKKPDPRDIFKLLHLLFVSSNSVEQKCDILKHKFGFTLTPELTQGLNDMYEFSQKIVTESLAQGRKEVLDQLKAIKELRRSGKSLDEALQALNIPESEQPSFRDLLS